MILHINELELTVGNQNPFSVIHPWTGPTQPDSIMTLNDSLYRSSILSDSELPLLSQIHVHRSLETTLAMCKVEICRTLGKLRVKNVISIMCCSVAPLELFWGKMHPPLTIYKHPMCAEIIEAFQKCHSDHPVGKFFGECTELKIKLDRCFRQEVSSKVVKRKKNLEKSRKLRETLQAYRKETAEGGN
ncbi:hypothetical protein AAG906_014836 [Vitis piasezkii]